MRVDFNYVLGLNEYKSSVIQCLYTPCHTHTHAHIYEERKGYLEYPYSIVI